MWRIELKDIEQIAFALARKLLHFDEPIPDFGTRFPNILESCIETPFQTHEKKDLYPTLTKKASMLFYLMVKNHPFQNGNKRIAVMTLLWVLAREKKWLEVDPKALYEFAVLVAESNPKVKDAILFFIEEFIEAHAVPFAPKP